MSERDQDNERGRNEWSRADRDWRKPGGDRQAQQWRDEGHSSGYQSTGYGQHGNDDRDRPYRQMGGADDRYSGDRGRFDRGGDDRSASDEFRDDHRSFGPGYGSGAYRSGPYGAGGGSRAGGSYGGYADRSRSFGSFTSEDQGGRDFSSRDRGFGAYGSRPSGSRDESSYNREWGDQRQGRDVAARPDAYATAGRDYMGADYGSWRQEGERRGFFERAGDEVASWFGSDEATRRREQDRRHDAGPRSDDGREDHRGRGPSGYTRSDDRIRDDANDALTHDRQVDATHVTVKVESGEVTLDGTVRDRQSKRRAEDAVEHIPGVKHVQNNLRVQDSTQTASAQSTSGHNQPGYNPASASGQASSGQGVSSQSATAGLSSAPAASATGSSAGSGTAGASSGTVGGTSTAASTAQKT